jgi:hypothetical protein
MSSSEGGETGVKDNLLNGGVKDQEKSEVGG